MNYPDFARFLYVAHHRVETGEHHQALKQNNSERNQDLKTWLVKLPDAERLKAILIALLISLVIGPTESYCRAWLSGRVKDSPQQYIQALAQSAWDSLQHFSKI